ncbi:MAG: ABC transporter permease subunit [Acidobacteria bacterium]|nr:ABC transporter permease subunit [Acidobacteriota bacterium]
MTKVALVARNTFRELVRDRVLYNLIFFALLLIGASLLVGQLAIGNLEKVISDIGLSSMRFFGMLIAIFIGIQLVSKEIDRRTIYSLLSKPVHRYELVIGKFFGLGMTLAINSSIMAAGIVTALLWVSWGYVPQISAVLPASYMIFLELLVITGIALAMSTLSSPTVSALVTFLLYIAGNFSSNLLAMADTTDAAPLKWLLKSLYFVIPNLSNFSAISTAAHGQMISGARLGFATLYVVIYCGILVSIAVLVFDRRDFK